MKRLIVITGTPATGKTTISKRLAAGIKDIEIINVNDVVKDKKLFTSHAKDGAMVVKMKELRNELIRRIKASKHGTVLIEGHLMSDIRIEGATAIVIREHLSPLLKRLKKRGYSRSKIEDNIVSEATNYCGINAAENYRKVYEIMSGPGAAAKIRSIVEGKKAKSDSIEIIYELNGLLNELGRA